MHQKECIPYLEGFLLYVSGTHFLQFNPMVAINIYYDS
jgi:hypothetical protein